MEVKAKNTKTGGECTVEYDFGADLDASVELFGSEKVYDGFLANAKVGLQSGLRACLAAGKDCQEFANTWKPGVRAPRVPVDPIAAATAAFAGMDEDAKRQFIEMLKSNM